MEQPPDWHPERWGVLAALIVALLTIWEKTKKLRTHFWWWIRRPWVLTDMSEDHEDRITVLEIEQKIQKDEQEKQGDEIKRIEGIAHRSSLASGEMREALEENNRLRRGE